MASLETSRSLKVGVTDFGPISSANIDLRPLTVFVGPSNTGKSYLAMLIYALQRAIGDIKDSFQGGAGSFLGMYGSPLWNDPSSMSDEVIHDLEEWFKKSFRGHSLRRSTDYETAPLPISFASMMDNRVWQTEETSTRFRNEIIRCFGVDNLTTLIRRNAKVISKVNIQTQSATHSELLQIDLELNRENLAVSATSPTNIPINIKPEKAASMYIREVLSSIDERPVQVPSLLKQRRSARRRSVIVPSLALDLVLPSLLGVLVRKAYYLPADRTGIIHAHRVVVSALIEAAATAGLRPTHGLPMLSGVLSDFLQALIQIGSRGRSEDKSKNKTGKMIEQQMLNGTIHIDRTSTGYPSFMYRPMGWNKNLALMNTSSMVSELAPIILYLQQIVNRGDLLIIEEPESHLHPAMQAEFAKILAAIVRDGVRIIVTTHSDWFLEQIGNLVRLSKLPVDERQAITDGIALDESEVGAWLFEKAGTTGGSQVAEIKVDPDTGLFPVDYGLVSESLYNESARIFNKIGERNDRV